MTYLHSMLINNIKLEDPLNEKVLPKFAVTLGLTHHSPTQGSIPDGHYLHKYGALTQEQRRALPGNAKMKAGVCVNEILQKHLADTIYKINPTTKKVSPFENKDKGRDKKEITYEELQKFKDYIPNDEKDEQNKNKYCDEIFEVVNNGFSSMEKIGAATSSPITCEEQISITQQVSSLLLPVVGRTDFAFGNGAEVSFPSGIVEIKTQWSKLGKLKNNGERSFIRLTPPAAPSFNHLTQCATYAAYYDYKVPVYLIYLTAKDYKIFDSSNCNDLTQEGLQKNFRMLCNIFKRREKILSSFEHLPKSELIQSAADIIDPQFSHPYAWHNYTYIDDAKQLWGMA